MQVTVLTYNVGNGMADPRRLAALLRPGAVDVVGLQELAHAQAHVLSELVDVYPYQVLMPGGFTGKGLLSRYPIRDHERLLLYPGRPDLQATLEVDGAGLNVWVVHPPPPRFAGPRFAFHPTAVSQITALAALALEHPPGVLLGDFNMTPRHSLYSSLRSAGLVDAFALAGVGRGFTLPRRLGKAARLQHGLHHLPLRPVARVDYIWCTPGVQPEAAWVGDDAGSDHLPVVARLALPRT
jgi:endonuclease/exonuclease/phosphatase family metal-dependent hydrolase